MAGETLVLGVGNPLLSDEGVGLHVLERLERAYELPEGVRTLDGGTLGLDLLYHLEGVENLLILDAVETGNEPGTLVRLRDDEVPAFFSIKVSPHQVGIPDMLIAAKLKGCYPLNVVLWGVQPSLLGVGLELSEAVAARVGALVERAAEELVGWGHQMRPRKTIAERP